MPGPQPLEKYKRGMLGERGMILHVLSYAKVHLIAHVYIVCDMKAKGISQGKEGLYQGEKVWEDSRSELGTGYNDLYI